ncbi:H-NS histone family protein [Chromobacterium haemolyticum]|uniref:H-NS histone family protein n=1 Tax=Chromobacterium haemolyticum TaxID=394935 RepID=UPI0024482D46|nr:H-NS histone family protein [Chromobacterium haemolyticum]MDH0342131.1 H-NS histone family protein [Chromobacterium haemolyticum]
MDLKELLLDFANLSEHSDEEINAALDALAEESERRQKAKKREGEEKIKALAKQFGLTTIDFVGSNTGPGRHYKTEVRYRNPKNDEEVWSGHGRPPSWIVKAEAAGQSREEFRVFKVVHTD